MGNAHFADTFTDRLYISGVAEFEPPDANDNALARLRVAERIEPFRKDSGLPNFDHP